MSRLRRAIELSRFFGLFSREVWRTLFPPFRGWSIGCVPCKNCHAARMAKRCPRGERLEFKGCGVLK